MVVCPHCGREAGDVRVGPVTLDMDSLRVRRTLAPYTFQAVRLTRNEAVVLSHLMRFQHVGVSGHELDKLLWNPGMAARWIKQARSMTVARLRLKVRALRLEIPKPKGKRSDFRYRLVMNP